MAYQRQKTECYIVTTLKPLVRRKNFHPHALNSPTHIPTAVALHQVELYSPSTLLRDAMLQQKKDC